MVDPDDFRLYTWADWAKLAPRDGEPFIRTVRFRLRVPEVLTLTRHDRPRHNAVTFSRRNLFKRDHTTCQYCGVRPGTEELTIDHVIPRSQGGQTTWENCVLACVACNARKANRTPEQAGHEAAQAPGPPRLEAPLRRVHRPDRELVAVPQRSLLERAARGRGLSCQLVSCSRDRMGWMVRLSGCASVFFSPLAKVGAGGVAGRPSGRSSGWVGSGPC